MAVDQSGNVYVADFKNSALKEILAVNGVIPPSPVIHTLGSGFRNPSAVTVDARGNVYVADTNNNVVKEILAVNGVIPASPTINTLGSGFSAPQGVAVDASGNVYVGDCGNSAVKEILAVDGVIPASPTILTLGSGFLAPSGVAIDARGNLYVADSGNNAVKEILAAGGVIPASPTINTLGSGFDTPGSVAVDGSGNVYVADFYNYAVKEILAVGGVIPASPTINTLGGRFVSQAGNGPGGVAVDASGNVYVGDTGNNRVVELPANGSNLGAVNLGSKSAVLTLTFTFDTAGSGVSTAVLTQGAANLDFADAGTGSCTTNGTGHSYNAGDTCTVNVTFAPKHPGARYGAAILRNGSGTTIATGNVVGTGLGPQVAFPSNTPVTLGSGFSVPSGVAVDGSGNVYVADADYAVKEILAVNGVIPASPTINMLGGGFTNPQSVAVDGSGNVYVADLDNAVKEILAVNGVIPASPTINTLGSGFKYPGGVAVDGSGNVYVADTGNNAVKEILAVNGVIPASPTIRTLSGFTYPPGVAVDGSGNVYVTDMDNGAVREILAVNGVIPASPTINTLASGFSYSSKVAVDSIGNVYVADPYNNVVFEILAVDGVIPASPTINMLGSGFKYPGGVAVDGSGNVYVADVGNDAVKELDSATPNLNFAATAVGSASDAQTVTVLNNGNAPLTISAVSFPANFPQSGDAANDCIPGTTLAGGATCTLTVEFQPTAPGAQSGSLLLTDNTHNATAATQRIALSGKGGLTQTIAFTQPASPVAYGVKPIILSATASSGLAVTFSVVSGPASVSGNKLTITGAGTVLVAAGQAGNNTYAAAPEVASVITVNQVTQTIAFTQPASPVAYGVKPITLSATGGTSGNPVTFSILFDSAFATLSGNKLTITGLGTVVVAANQAGNANYAAAPEVVRTIVVNKTTQTITFPQPTTPVIYGVAPITLKATGGASGNAVTFSIVSGPGKIAGNKLTITGAGTVVVAANQPGTPDYDEAAQVERSIAVTKAALTVTANNVSRAYGAANPAFTDTIKGFVNGDTAAKAVTGAASLSTTATTTSPVATYPIVAKIGTLAAKNYSFTLVNGTLTVKSLGTAATPAFKPAAGSYKAAQTVTLTDATTGAAIHYTIDGTAPTAKSTLYTSAGIKVTATETVKAIAIAPGYANSAVASAKYTIQ